MSRKKRERGAEDGKNPYGAIPGTGVKIKAGGGGNPLQGAGLGYDGEALTMPDLASLPPCRIEKVEGPVRLVEATPEELTFARRYCPKGPPGGDAA